VSAIRLVALAVAATYASLGLLHGYWAIGGVDSRSAALPERDGQTVFRPGRAITLVVAGLLGVACVLVLARAGWIRSGLPGPGVAVGSGGVALVMLARAVGDFRNVGFFKPTAATRFARLDRLVYSPVALLLGLGTAWVAVSGPIR
jgi:hypothetical protein